MSVKRYLVDISSPVCEGGILKEVVLASDYDALKSVVRELAKKDCGHRLCGVNEGYECDMHKRLAKVLNLIGEKGV